jgi:hypothetical protein
VLYKLLKKLKAENIDDDYFDSEDDDYDAKEKRLESYMEDFVNSIESEGMRKDDKVKSYKHY